jgi:hypothetical protein
MKIALLGASRSGKTVYFSGLSYKFRHSVAFIPLSPDQLKGYADLGVSRRVGFRMGPTSAGLEKSFTRNSELFSQRPIVEWPEPTEDLDRSKVDIHFKFCAVEFEGLHDIESHKRTIELYDPTGEALAGIHERSDSIVKDLITCDIAIAFLPANVIAECVEDNDLTALQNRILMGTIIDIVMQARKRMKSNDILPICFVISKSDILENRHENFINDMNRMLYDNLIVPFSNENPNIMLCVCPTSVVDPETGNFRASNLEWPFLFAAGGTIFRNSIVRRDEAKLARNAARRAEDDAEELRQSGWWNRFTKFIQGDGVNARLRRAASFYDESGRLVGEADDDHELAKSAWSSLAIEGKARGVRIFMEGKEIDPRMVTGAI